MRVPVLQTISVATGTNSTSTVPLPPPQGRVPSILLGILVQKLNSASAPVYVAVSYTDFRSGGLGGILLTRGWVRSAVFPLDGAIGGPIGVPIFGEQAGLFIRITNDSGSTQAVEVRAEIDVR